MKQRITMVFPLVLLAALAATASAQSGRGRGCDGPGLGGCDGPGGPGWRMERLAERLDLSEEQQTAIAKIHDEAENDALELRKEMARLRNEMHGEMLKDEPAESAVVDLAAKMGELRTKLQVIHLKARLAVRGQLSDEQRDQLLLMEQHGRGGGRHMAPRAPRGDCFPKHPRGRGQGRGRDI